MQTVHTQRPPSTILAGLAADLFGRDHHRAPLVLLHGLTFDRTVWQPVLRQLEHTDPGRRVLAIDLPGHGDLPAAATYDLDTFGAQLQTALDEAGLEAPVVVGHSAGALAATVYAAHHPTRGVVNIDQPLEVSGFAELVRSLADELRGPGFPVVWQRFADSWRTDLLPLAARNLVRATSNPRQDVVLGYWKPLLDGHGTEIDALIEDTRGRLRKAGTPYRYIAGDWSPGYRLWLGRRLPAAHLETWSRTGHFPHLARPAAFAERLAATAHASPR